MLPHLLRIMVQNDPIYFWEEEKYAAWKYETRL